MGYPTTEFLKTLIDRVERVERQVYSGHPIDPPPYIGYVYDWTQDSDGVYLKVVPTQPSVSDGGDLVFDDGDHDFFKGITATTRYDKVYPINSPNTLQDLKIRFNKGDLISYWRYTGDAGNLDLTRGTYVTKARDWFWAKVSPSLSSPGGPCIFNYNFTACYWNPTSSAFTTTDISGTCKNMNEVYNACDDSKGGIGLTISMTGVVDDVDGGTCVLVPVGPTLAQVYQFWNPGDHSYTYYFAPLTNSAKTPA